MLRDALTAMRTALDHGPDHCPPDLFAGDVDRVLLGLKAHANTISHARHVAMEESFPRTRALIGADRFHAVAAEHLASASVRSRPLRSIGHDFAGRLDDHARDLAAIEWAWLDAYGSADAPAFDLPALGGLSPDALLDVMLARHPAARLCALHASIEFDHVRLDHSHALITRPDVDVAIRAVDQAVAALFATIDRPTSMASLLQADAAATTTLIETGALTSIQEFKQ